MSGRDRLADLFAEHAGVNLTAAWEGSPDPTSPSNIRRVCKCGALIGRTPYPAVQPGRTVRFRIGGEVFDEPHRAHLAAVVRAFLASDETVGRVAGRMSGDLPEEPMWSLVVITRAALAAATEADR